MAKEIETLSIQFRDSELPANQRPFKQLFYNGIHYMNAEEIGKMQFARLLPMK